MHSTENRAGNPYTATALTDAVAPVDRKFLRIISMVVLQCVFLLLTAALLLAFAFKLNDTFAEFELELPAISLLASSISARWYIVLPIMLLLASCAVVTYSVLVVYSSCWSRACWYVVLAGWIVFGVFLLLGAILPLWNLVTGLAAI